MKTLIKVLGGSHSYGLNTESSDRDERGVFCHTELSKVIGLERFEHLDSKVGELDSFLWEFRHYLNMLKKTNTSAMEILFIEPEDILEEDPIWNLIRKNKLNLIDSERFYKSLKGYIHNERRMTMGDRTGVLGSKRKASLDKYGYSYKNAVQLFRLAWAGTYFFKFGIFPVKVSRFDEGFHHFLMNRKLYPASHTRDEIEEDSIKLEQALDKSYNERTSNFKFDDDLANNLLLKVYGPVVEDLMKKVV